MRRNRRVKIVATLGPVSTNEDVMRAMFEAGADVFRVNMSHATFDGLRDAHAIVRKLETEFSRPIGILIDLQGPKLRIGNFDSGAIGERAVQPVKTNAPVRKRRAMLEELDEKGRCNGRCPLFLQRADDALCFPAIIIPAPPRISTALTIGDTFSS